MQPRKTTSKNPQSLPLDYVKMVREVVEKNYKLFTKDKNVVIGGGIYMQEVAMFIGFQNKKGVKQVNFHCSIDFDPKKKDILDKMALLLDSIGSMISQYVEADGDIELPTEWTEFELEKKKVFLKFSTENTDLEAQADKILNPED